MTGRPPPLALQLPENPTGADVARALRLLRLAVFRGDVVVDGRALDSWPVGARLALVQSQRRAERRGHRFDLAGRPPAG